MTRWRAPVSVGDQGREGGRGAGSTFWREAPDGTADDLQSCASPPPPSPSQLGPSPAPASERKMRAGSGGLPGRERGPVLSYAVYLRSAGCLSSASLPSGRHQVEHVNDEPALVGRVGRARSASEDAAVLTTARPSYRYRAVSRSDGHSGNRSARAVFASARPPGRSFCG